MANKAMKEKKAPGAFLRVIHFVAPRMRSYLTGFMATALAEVTFYISIPLTVRLMIDSAIAGDMRGLVRGVLFMSGVSAVGAPVFVVFIYLFMATLYRLTGDLRKKAFGRALALPAPYYEARHSGDTVSRLTNDINTLKSCADWPLWNLVVMLMAGTGAVISMIVLDWRVSLVLLPTSAAFTFLNMRMARSIEKLSARIQAASGRLTESLSDILGGFAVIKQFRLQERMRDRFEEHNREVLSASMSRTARSAGLESYNVLMGWLNFGGILAAGAVLAGQGRMSFGTMLAMVNLMWNVNRMLRETGRAVAQFQGYLAGEARVSELMCEPEEPERAESGRYAVSNTPALAVAMRDISFSYDGQRKALDGFSMEVPAGGMAALVGPSGGGKTTVLKILLGFHKPAEGSIHLGPGIVAEDGDGQGLSYRSLRQAMAYVPQEPFLFDGTIAENIGCGRPGACAEDIARAANAARADEFIDRLEKGYDTLVGERGLKLSGGQKQRIAIARAFLKDAPILLLDEATSSLDSHSEEAIQAALKELGRCKTVIVIAHRLSTVEEADVIYVVDEGRAVESGRHAELLAAGGLYKKLYDVQFALGAEKEAGA